MPEFGQHRAAKDKCCQTNLISSSGLERKHWMGSTLASLLFLTYSTGHAPNQTTEMSVNMKPQHNRCRSIWKYAPKDNYLWFPGKTRKCIKTGINDCSGLWCLTAHIINDGMNTQINLAREKTKEEQFILSMTLENKSCWNGEAVWDQRQWEALHLQHTSHKHKWLVPAYENRFGGIWHLAQDKWLNTVMQNVPQRMKNIILGTH